MTSIKVKYCPSTIEDREGAIYYQVTHDRKVRQLNTDYYVFDREWDASRAMVTAKSNGDRKPPPIPACLYQGRKDRETGIAPACNQEN